MATLSRLPDRLPQAQSLAEAAKERHDLVEVIPGVVGDGVTMIPVALAGDTHAEQILGDDAPSGVRGRWIGETHEPRASGVRLLASHLDRGVGVISASAAGSVLVRFGHASTLRPPACRHNGPIGSSVEASI